MNAVLMATLLTMKAYHITQWDDLYENAATRSVRVLSYYSKPLKLYGEGVGFMLQNEDGLALYGTWTFVIESLAASAPQEWRGWLVRNGTPLDAARMSALTRIPIEQVERALKFFSTPPMDWLELADLATSENGALPKRPQRAGSAPSANHERAPSVPLACHGHANGTPPEHHGHAFKKKKKREEEYTYVNKEIKRGLSGEEAAKQQSRQFSATQSIVSRLESVQEDDRTPEQERELKRMRGRLKAIQQKQAAGDFSPLEESA